MNKKIIVIGLLGIFLLGSINVYGTSISKETDTDISTLDKGTYDFGDIKVSTSGDDPARNAEIELSYQEHFDIAPGTITVEVDYDIDICGDLCNWVELKIKLGGIEGLKKEKIQTIDDSKKGKISFSFELEEHTSFKIWLYADYFYEPPFYEDYHKSGKEHSYGGSCGKIDIDAGTVRLQWGVHYSNIGIYFNDIPGKLDVGEHGKFLMFYADVKNCVLESSRGSSAWIEIWGRPFYSGKLYKKIKGKSGSKPPSGTIMRAGYFFKPDECCVVHLGGHINDGFSYGRSDCRDIHCIWDEGNNKPIVSVVSAPDKVHTYEDFQIKVRVDDFEGQNHYIGFDDNWGDLDYTDWFDESYEDGHVFVITDNVDDNGKYEYYFWARDAGGIVSERLKVQIKANHKSKENNLPMIQNIFNNFPVLDRFIERILKFDNCIC